LSSTFYYSPLLSSKARLGLVSTKTKIEAALSASLKVFNLLSLKTINLFAYKLKSYLIYNNRELGRIPQVL